MSAARRRRLGANSAGRKRIGQVEPRGGGHFRPAKLSFGAGDYSLSLQKKVGRQQNKQALETARGLLLFVLLSLCCAMQPANASLCRPKLSISRDEFFSQTHLEGPAPPPKTR